MALLQYKRSVIQCDFGTVPIGGSRKQSLKEINLKTVPLDYIVEIEHYSQFNSDFVVEPTRFLDVKTNEEIELSIAYTPSTPNKIDLYYFEIHRSDGFVLHIEVRGKAIGPRVCIQKNILKFDGKLINEAQKKAVSIQNCSEAGANFMFDSNGVDCVKFTPEYGFLEPFQTLRILVSYTNRLRGRKFHQFMCLFENHSPIFIYIICTGKKALNDKQIDKPMLFYSIKTLLPPNEITPDELRRVIDNYELNRNCIKLSENHIDFGTCRFGDMKQKKITLTNISGAETTIQWIPMSESDFGKSNLFRIEYELNTNTILPSQTVDINLIFTPKQHDKFYSGRFDAVLFWMGTMILIPLKITLMGNSFQNDSWIAQYSLDLLKNSVHLLPSQGLENPTDARTFTLKKHSSLPMMFKLYSSTTSSFNIKPKQGIIRGPYQIFTVESKSNTVGNHGKLLNEIWTLVLNLEYQVGIKIIQTIEEPNLIVNDGKPVVFPVTHPLSCQAITVNLKNPTKSCLRYSFEVNDQPSSVFKPPKSRSSMNGNENITSFWFFIPEETGQYESNVTLLVHKIGSEEIIKRIPILIQGECKKGQLKVDRKKFTLGKIMLGSYKSELFSVMNDGESPLHISFGCKTLSGIELNEISFHPSRLTVEAGKSAQVELKAKPVELDQHTLKIGCNLRSSPFSRQTIPNSWMDLVEFEMIGIFPKLKIIDVRIESIPFLTRYNIWRILEINRINKAIGSLSLGDYSKELEINLPILKGYPPFNSKIDIEMLIKNESECNIAWSLRRKDQPCSCKTEEKRTGFNTFIKKLCCEHVSKIVIEPTAGTLQSYKTMLWTISVEYFPPGEQKVEFALSLFPENKSEPVSKVLIFFKRVVPDETPSLFPCDSSIINNDIKFEMQPIFINELKSQSQVMWIYNPSKHPVKYSVHKVRGGTKYIKCLNPSETVQPFTQHAIIFSYLPVEINPAQSKYNILIDNKKKYNLTVIGSSQLYPEYNPFALCVKMTSAKSLLVSPEVELSVSHIAFPVISSNCEMDRIFFINNKTNKTFRYHWKRIFIKGRLKLEIIPKCGKLESMQSHLLTLKCSTLGRTCHLMAGLVCRVTDETLSIKVRENKLKFLEEENQLSQLFTITEKGISFPHKISMPEDEVNQKFLILNVSVVSSTVKFKSMEVIPGELGIFGRKSMETDFTTEDDISVLHCDEILSSCLRDIVFSSDLERLLKSGLPCVYYKDLYQGNIVKNDEDKKCPTNCIIAILNKVLSETLGNTDSCFVSQNYKIVSPHNDL